MSREAPAFPFPGLEMLKAATDEAGEIGDVPVDTGATSPTKFVNFVGTTLSHALRLLLVFTISKNVTIFPRKTLVEWRDHFGVITLRQDSKHL